MDNQDELTAVAYLRTAAGGDSALREQEQRCRELAASVDAHLVAIYADRNMSGTVSLRPGLSCLLDHLEREPVDIVIADGAARLTRSADRYQELRQRFERHGATLLTEEPGAGEQAA